jgi:hypothetical protein
MTNQACRPLPIILTSTSDLLQLQKQIKGIVKGSFEFQNTKNKTRVLTEEMAHFSAIKTIFLQLLPEITNPIDCCFLYKAKDLSAPPRILYSELSD